MDFLTLFFAPMLVAVRWPAAPFVVAGLFAACQWLLVRRHGWAWQTQMWRRPLLFACALWLVYGLYELQVQATGLAANVRIDLLVLTPILYVFSAAGLWWLRRCWNDPRHAWVQPSGPDAEAASADETSPEVPEQPGGEPGDRSR